MPSLAPGINQGGGVADGEGRAPFRPPHCPVLPPSLDGDLPPAAMRTSRCSHLPGAPPERPRPLAPNGKSLPGGSGGGPASSLPQYVMQVSAKDGQLLSSVVRTLATQRYVKGGGTGRARSLLGSSAPSPAAAHKSRGCLKGRWGGVLREGSPWCNHQV